MRHFVVTYRWEIALVVAMPALGWGWWYILFTTFVEIYGLAYLLVHWSLFIVLPALLMGALHVRLRHRGYGWESLLLVATPFWAGLVGATYITLLFRTLLPDSERWEVLVLGLGDWGIPNQIFTVILLAASYPAVRRFGREFLGLAWRFLLAVEIVRLAVNGLLLAMQIRGAVSSSEPGAWDAELLGALLAGPVAVLLLLRFVRRASRFSLAHAFFMVALAFAFPWHRLFEYSGRAWPETDVGFLLMTIASVVVYSCVIAMTILAAWLLRNFDTWTPALRGRATALLFGLRSLGAILPALWLFQGFVLTSVSGVPLTMSVILVAWFAVLWAVYLTRVRHPAAVVEER